MHYNFEWDPEKADINLSKHGVSFEQASEVFLDPLQLSLLDREHSIQEERWITLGKIKNDDVVVVIHTYFEQQDTAIIRIISARKATKHERKQYEKI